MGYEDLREQLAKAIGEIAIAFEHLHHRMFQIAASVLRQRGLDGQAAELLLRDYQFDGLRQMWRKLMELQYPDDVELVRRIDTALMDAGQARNNSIHLLWGYDDVEGRFTGEKIRKGKGQAEIDAAELTGMAEKISKAGNLLFSLHFRTMLQTKPGRKSIAEIFEMEGTELRPRRSGHTLSINRSILLAPLGKDPGY